MHWHIHLQITLWVMKLLWSSDYIFSFGSLEKISLKHRLIYIQDVQKLTKMLNNLQNYSRSLCVNCAHLIAYTGSKTIVVVFNLYFDVLGGALLGSAQALNMRRENITCYTDVHQNIQNIHELALLNQPKGSISPCPWTSPFAPASSGRIWSHLYSRRCSWGQQTTSVSSGLESEQQHHYITVIQQNTPIT